MTTTRLTRLPLTRVGGVAYPTARDRRSRLVGLAGLDRLEALPGLLIPDCSCVHTFWMRFALDLRFLDREGEVVAVRLAVPPRRFARHRAAAAILELPARTAVRGDADASR